MMTRTIAPLRVPLSLSYADRAESPCCWDSVDSMRHDRESGESTRSEGMHSLRTSFWATDRASAIAAGDACRPHSHSGIFMKLFITLLAFSSCALAQSVA